MIGPSPEMMKEKFKGKFKDKKKDNKGKSGFFQKLGKNLLKSK